MNDIVIQAFIHRLLPFEHEVLLDATRAFNLTDYQQQMPLAAMGALLASAVLYGIGIWLRRLPEKVSTETQQARIEKLRAVARGWLPYLLILSPTPVGGVLTIAAGFFALPRWQVVLMVLLAEVSWRLAPLL